MKRFDNLLMTFLRNFQEIYMMRIHDMVIMYAQGKNRQVDKSAVEFLPLLNSLYLLHAHGDEIPDDTVFKDILLSKKDLIKLFKLIDKTREGVTESREDVLAKMESKDDETLIKHFTNSKNMPTA